MKRTQSIFPQLEILLVLSACLWFAGGAWLLSTDFGATLEEVAGLTTVPVAWEPALSPGSPGSEPPAMHLSQGRPVWGIEKSADSYFPVMIDVHIGALSFYPLRAALATGGLPAARLLHIVLGLGAVAAAMIVARRIFGRSAGFLATVFLATSPVFMLAHIFARPDVQWAFLFPMLGVLALLYCAGSQSTVLLCLSAFLFGVGVAAKNTALWTSAAAVLSLLVYGARPRGIRESALAAVSFLLPLLPQACFFSFTQSYGQLAARIGGGRSVLDALSLERLSFFASHFIVSIAGFGSGAEWIPSGGGAALPLRAWVSGVFILTAVLAAPVLILVYGAERRQKAFAAGFGMLCLEYLAFYYLGDTYFLLLIPWIAIALAGITAVAWRVRESVPVSRLRTYVRTVIVVAWAFILANQAIEAWKFLNTVSSPFFPFMRLSTQRELAEKLDALRIDNPWTISYTFAGVMELLTEGRVRPRHAYYLFENSCRKVVSTTHEGILDEYRGAWDSVFRRMGPGIHHVVAQPNPSAIDMNPCREGHRALRVLSDQAAGSGGAVSELFSVGRPGSVEEFKVFEVRLP